MNNREDYLKDLETINAQIMAVEKEIADLDTKRATLKEKIKLLQQLKHSIAGFKVQPTQRIDAKVTNESSEKEKIILFRSLFRGLEDVLSPSLKNRLIRLAAFQNPEFYKAQAMRFPIFGFAFTLFRYGHNFRTSSIGSYCAFWIKTPFTKKT